MECTAGADHPALPKDAPARPAAVCEGHMLHIHFLQQWYALSDPGMEEALHETPGMRRLARLGGLDNIRQRGSGWLIEKKTATVSGGCLSFHH